MNLTNQTILITGGAGGIGLEMVRQLHAKGNTLIITGRDQAKLETAKSRFPGLQVIQTNVADPAAINALFEDVSGRFPNLSGLINNAGIMRNVNLHESIESLESLTEEIDTNLKGPIQMCRAFLPLLKKQKHAFIVNVSSGLAFVPLPVNPVYSASKAALHSFTLSLRVQLKNTQVQVFELAPPATLTELIKDFPKQDMRGVSIMKVEDMVQAAIKGIENNQLEIRPGQSNQLKLMSRLAPQFILDQMSKPVDRMLADSKH